MQEKNSIPINGIHLLFSPILLLRRLPIPEKNITVNNTRAREKMG
jgi:hypothetical protein